MRIWYNNILDNSRYVVDVQSNRVRIGRGPENDIVLESPFVAAEAVVLQKRGPGWELVALGLNGCQIGEEEVRGGERRPIDSGQTFRVFPYSLTLEYRGPKDASNETVRLGLDQDLSRMIHAIHLELLRRMDLEVSGPQPRQETDEYLLVLERNLEEIARSKGFLDPKRSALQAHVAGHCVRAELLNGLIARSGQASSGAWQTGDGWSRMITAVPEREEELAATVQAVTAALGLKAVRDLSQQIAAVERGFWACWDRLAAADLHADFGRYLALRHLKKEVKDIVFGYGPLEDLLRTPIISEIMVVDRDRIYVEKEGVLENSGRRFISDEVTQSIIERIVARVGRRIDKSRPLVDARLSDGSRVNAVIPPLAVSGPCLTIRKFPQRKMLVEDLIERRALTRTVAEFLRAAVITRRNILISGGTGSGKTTMLNCLSDFIPDKERIVTIEDTAELQLKKEHVVRLETKESNIEGAGAYTIRDLVKNSLRMRPDRIVVGECRGPEALDMLQAMNTGHDGSMTTIHANSAADVVLRLEVLVQMAADLPIDSIHRQIASAIDLIVQLVRLRDGRRVVSQVTEVVGVDGPNSEVITKDIFLLDPALSDDGAVLAPTGCLPTFMDQLIGSGLIQLNTFYL